MYANFNVIGTSILVSDCLVDHNFTQIFNVGAKIVSALEWVNTVIPNLVHSNLSMYQILDDADY